MIFIKLITVICDNEKQHRIFTVLFFYEFWIVVQYCNWRSSVFYNPNGLTFL